MEKHARNRALVGAAVFFLVMATSACQAPGSDSSGAGQQGTTVTDGVHGEPQPLPVDGSGDSSTPPPGGPAPALGDTCQSSDTSRICLSLRYVVYENGEGVPVASTDEVLANLETINRIWSQCNIAFEIGEFVSEDPTSKSLAYSTSTSGELDTIRKKYASSDQLLVVSTGTWSGSLGSGAANAWTSMPGSANLGVVMEAPVADFGPIVAHELGHYLNLGHYNDSTNNMNPSIGSSSTQLTSSQCSTARSASMNFWAAMQR